MFFRTWWFVIAVCGCDVGTLLSFGDDPDPEVLGSRGGHRDAHTMVIGRATDAIHLDPGLPTDNESVEIIEQVYDKLLDYERGTSKVVPGLATRWHVENGGTDWVFELRRGVKFHDGTPLNADAVVFSLERQRDPRHAYHRRGFKYWQSVFANVQEIEKVDEYRVRITIERPYSPFLANMAMFVVAIVSPTAVAEYGDDFSNHPVGTGPFRFVSWNNGRIVLERNDDYWGEKPRFDRIIFQSIPDQRQRLVALESGSIDVAHSILPEELQFVDLHPRLTLYTTMANSVTYLALNNDKQPFTDLRVRRAANYAINKQPIVKVLWHGLAVPAHTPLPAEQWGHYVPPDVYKYDPDRARVLVQEAKRDGLFAGPQPYKLFITSTPRPYLPNPIRLGRVVQSNLRDVGINTELVVKPFREFVESLSNGEHDLCIYGWVSDTGDPDNFLYVLLDRDNAKVGRATNVAFFRDPVVHGQLVYAQESENIDERSQNYARAQQIIHEQAPWVPLAHSKVAIAARDDIAGIVMNPNGVIHYEGIYRTADHADEASMSVPSRP